jgi:hypothetical protein
MENLQEEIIETLEENNQDEFEVLNVIEKNCVRGGDGGQTDYPTPWPPR